MAENADLERLLIDAPCIVENPWGAQWDGPCTGSWHVHVPCAIAALAEPNDVSICEHEYVIHNPGLPCAACGQPTQTAGVERVAAALAVAIRAFMRGDGDFADQMAMALDAWDEFERKEKESP